MVVYKFHVTLIILLYQSFSCMTLDSWSKTDVTVLNVKHEKIKCKSRNANNMTIMKNFYSVIHFKKLDICDF